MRCFLFLIPLLWGFSKLNAQKIQMGMSLYLDYNLYHRYQKPDFLSPERESAGQLLNLLPLGGFGFWIGQAGSFTVGIEGGLDYMPFSIDLQEYKGLGAVSFPLLLRATQPFAPWAEISPFVGVGIGLQWNRIDLYGRPSGAALGLNNYFKTQVVELSIGLGRGWQPTTRQTGLLAFYARIGKAAEGAHTLNFGLRAKLLINRNPPLPNKKQDPSSYAI